MQTKRALANIQTAALAQKIYQNVDTARKHRATWVLNKGSQDFTGIGKEFAQTLNCKCASVDGIVWNEIDEIMQYVIVEVKKEVVEEVETQSNILEGDMPSKTLEVSDKVSDGVDQEPEPEPEKKPAPKKIASAKKSK
jgi:hypothetical protein